MDESGEEAMIGCSVNPSPPSEVNRQRRSIQTKLPWVVRSQGGGDESDGENKGKTRRKRESLPKGSKKSLAACNEASKLKKGSKRSCVLKNRSPQIKQTQEKDEATLKVKNHEQCKAIESNGLQCKESCMRVLTSATFDATVNLDDQSQHLQQPGSNLQLEGNVASKESIELSTGTRMHQFFTRWEETKRVEKLMVVSNREHFYYSAHDEDVLLGSPIHIFDKVEDEFIGLHWQNWVFENKTPDSDGYYASKHASSIFEGSVKPLELDTACHPELPLDGILAKTNFTTSGIASSSLLERQNKNEQLWQLVTDNGGGDGKIGVCFPFRHNNCMIDMDTLKDQTSVKERLDSYNLRRGNLPESTLWTDKYQPENTLELCGNIKSIRILNDWLKSWDEGPRSNRSFNSLINNGHDNSSDIESYMDDVDDEAIRKNVLLLTGPIGSGKSAAIHACAKEQGFTVIEVNTSDVRNGALMKQKFGDSMETSAFTPSLCLYDDPIDERKKIIPSLSSGIIDISDADDNSSQRTSENCQQSKTASGNSRKVAEEKNTNCWKLKGSIQVFEDVDVVFCEDMGFISAVLQLAEKTKKPIILTSNDKNPILPHLDPLLVDFTAPSSEELLSHAQMVCAVEGVHISSKLLERLISHCRRDIRKMLMLLQFWCQGTRCQIDDSKWCTYNPLPFDVGAAHLIMPRVLPWDFPCGLSEKIEEEISRGLSLFEESLCLENAKEHMLCTTEMIDSSKIGINKTNKKRNNKKGILKQKCSFLECSDFSVDANGLEDFSDAADTPGELAQGRVKHRRRIILSSQSDDDPSTDEVLPKEIIPVNHDSLILHDMTMAPILDAKEVHNQVGPSSSVVNQSKIKDTSCDTSKLQDSSCVPESSFACLIDTSKDVDSLSKLDYVSQASANLSDHVSSLPVQSRADVNHMNDSISESNKLSEDNIGYNCGIYLESVCREPHEQEEPQALSGCVVMDDSSHVGSNLLAPVKLSNPVQQKWQKLKSCREDLKSCLNSNKKDAYSIIKLSSQLADLISQTDVMINGCESVSTDILDRSLMLSDESDNISWDDRRFEMGSTYAQHGFCFYANKCVAIGSSFGYHNTVDLAQEMLASSTNVMALGKLLTNHSLSSKGNSQIEAMKFGSWGRESDARLFNAILPKVPTRVSLSLKGSAFLEYASFMSQISKIVDSRLAEITNEKQGRRFRAPVHYFNSGQYSLSSEHVKLLSQSFCFKEGVR